MAFVAWIAEEVAMMALALVTRVVGVGVVEEAEEEEGLAQAAKGEVATGAAEESILAEHSRVSQTY